MADYEARINIEADDSKLTSIENRLKAIERPTTLTINSNLSQVSKELSDVETRLKNLRNVNLNLNLGSGTGNGGGGGSRSKKPSDDIKDYYNTAMYYQRKMNAVKVQLAKTDKNTDPLSFNTLKTQLAEYKKEFDSANSFSAQFTARQKTQLERLKDSGNQSFKIAESKLFDSASNNSSSDLEKQLSKVEQIKKALDNGSLDSKISSLTSRKNKLGISNQAIDDQLGTDEITGNISKLRQSLDDAFANGSAYSTGMQDVISQFDQINNAITLTDNNLKQLRMENPVQPKDLNETVANGIQRKLMTGDLDNKVSGLATQFQKLGVDDSGITGNIEHLKGLLSDIGNAQGFDEMISKYKEFNALAAQTKEQIKGIKDYQNLDFGKKNLSNDIDTWLNKNTAAAKDFGARLEEIKAQITDADGAKLDNLKKQFTSIKKEAAAAGKTGLSFIDQLKESAQKILPVITAADLVRRGVDTVKQMAEETVSVDTSMTELKRVTSLSSDEYDKLYGNMTKSAKQYGAELDTMINSTASWVRLGFDANTANKLAEVSTMYQHVTDLDEGTAVKNLVTAYKGYQDQLLATTNNDSVAAVEKVADIFDKLGNELPVTAAQVGAGMNKWASVAQSAGATIEEAAAMTVGSGSVTQDFEQAGSSLKIATLRIQGMKGALEELGEEVDDNISSTSKIQTQILNLTGGKVNIFEDDGKSFRNIYEIFRDIAKILPELSDTDRSQLLETIAGKNRSNSILAMLQNWGEVERALTAANDAAGTAREENDIYMDSIQGKMQSLQASWQALSNTVVDSNILKTGLDVVNGIVDGLDAVVGKIGPIMTILTGGTIFNSIKSIS